MTPIKLRRWARVAVTGSLIVWAIAVISCTTLSRIAVVPPEIPGATFVGSDDCAVCHAEISARFALPNTHPVMFGDMSCSDCHDPHEGSAIMGAGAQLLATNDTCLKCHEA